MFDENNPQIEEVLNICNGTSTNYAPVPPAGQSRPTYLLVYTNLNLISRKKCLVKKLDYFMEEQRYEQGE